MKTLVEELKLRAVRVKESSANKQVFADAARTIEHQEKIINSFNNWQPIDTINKHDGILICTNTGNVYAGIWVMNYITEHEAIKICQDDEGNQQVISLDIVTHWQSLPPKPVGN